MKDQDVEQKMDKLSIEDVIRVGDFCRGYGGRFGYRPQELRQIVAGDPLVGCQHGSVDFLVFRPKPAVYEIGKLEFVNVGGGCLLACPGGTQDFMYTIWLRQGPTVEWRHRSNGKFIAVKDLKEAKDSCQKHFESLLLPCLKRVL